MPFAYPYYDIKNYFPNIKNSPTSPKKLWDLIEFYNKDEKNFYGGNTWHIEHVSELYNSPVKIGKNFSSRRRITEIYAKISVHLVLPLIVWGQELLELEVWLV